MLSRAITIVKTANSALIKVMIKSDEKAFFFSQSSSCAYVTVRTTSYLLRRENMLPENAKSPSKYKHLNFTSVVLDLSLV